MALDPPLFASLALVGVPMRRVSRVVQDQRDKRYNLLRGYFRGADDDTVDARDEARLATVTLPSGCRSVGMALGDTQLESLGAQVVSLRRGSGQTLLPQSDAVLQDGDTLVLSGKPEALALAEEKLLRRRLLKGEVDAA